MYLTCNDIVHAVLVFCMSAGNKDKAARHAGTLQNLGSARPSYFAAAACQTQFSLQVCVANTPMTVKVF